MSAKTKIVVLHRRELLYTAVFSILGVLFLALLVMLFLPGEEGDVSGQAPNSVSESSVSPTSAYIPGIYTTELVLGSQSLAVEVIVDDHAITSIRMVNLSDAITTMYPLLQPTFDKLCDQVMEKQSAKDIVYSTESKYTSLVLLEAIDNSLEKAQLHPDA